MLCEMGNPNASLLLLYSRRHADGLTVRTAPIAARALRHYDSRCFLSHPSEQSRVFTSLDRMETAMWRRRERHIFLLK